MHEPGISWSRIEDSGDRSRLLQSRKLVDSRRASLGFESNENYLCIQRPAKRNFVLEKCSGSCAQGTRPSFETIRHATRGNGISWFASTSGNTDTTVERTVRRRERNTCEHICSRDRGKFIHLIDGGQRATLLTLSQGCGLEFAFP